MHSEIVAIAHIAGYIAGGISVIPWIGRFNRVQEFFFRFSAGTILFAEPAGVGPTPCHCVTLAHIGSPPHYSSFLVGPSAGDLHMFSDFRATAFFGN